MVKEMLVLEVWPGSHAAATSLASAQTGPKEIERSIEIAEDPGRGPPFDGAVFGGNLGSFREHGFCLSGEASFFRLKSFPRVLATTAPSAWRRHKQPMT